MHLPSTVTGISSRQVTTTQETVCFSVTFRFQISPALGSVETSCVKLSNTSQEFYLKVKRIQDVRPDTVMAKNGCHRGLKASQLVFDSSPIIFESSASPHLTSPSGYRSFKRIVWSSRELLFMEACVSLLQTLCPVASPWVDLDVSSQGQIVVTSAELRYIRAHWESLGVLQLLVPQNKGWNTDKQIGTSKARELKNNTLPCWLISVVSLRSRIIWERNLSGYARAPI